MRPGRRRSGSFLTERTRSGPNREFGAARQTDAKLQRQRQATTPHWGLFLLSRVGAQKRGSLPAGRRIVMIRDLVDSTALSDRFDPGIWAL
jgi:hypothetical protein